MISKVQLFGQMLLKGTFALLTAALQAIHRHLALAVFFYSTCRMEDIFDVPIMSLFRW